MARFRGGLSSVETVSQPESMSVGGNHVPGAASSSELDNPTPAAGCACSDRIASFQDTRPGPGIAIFARGRRIGLTRGAGCDLGGVGGEASIPPVSTSDSSAVRASALGRGPPCCVGRGIGRRGSPHFSVGHSAVMWGPSQMRQQCLWGHGVVWQGLPLAQLKQMDSPASVESFIFAFLPLPLPFGGL